MLLPSEESEGWRTPPSKKKKHSSTNQTWADAVMMRLAMTMPLPASKLVKKNRIVPLNKSVKFI